LQTLRHSYCLVAGLRTWRCEQCEVPSGGNCIDGSGAMESGASEHGVVGQSGGRSMLLEQSGCISLSTHRHSQSASAVAERTPPKANANSNRIMFFHPYLCCRPIFLVRAASHDFRSS
jgi:hypothetical protein